MANNFVFIIDGVDFSDCITQREDIKETPQYIDGRNAGTSKVGTPIWDRVRTTYGYTQPLKPLPRQRLAQFARACEPNSVTLTYNSFLDGSPVTKKAQLKMGAVQYATNYGTKIYYGASVSVELAD